MTPEWAKDALLLAPGAGTLGLLALGAIRAKSEQRALLPLKPQPLKEALTVVMPARNEGARIGPTLRALLADPSETLRVLVYDDRSQDDTAAQVRALAKEDARLTLIAGEREPEPGRFGKPSALARATDYAEENGLARELLLFLDADVELQPGALGALVAALRESGADALSASPHLRCQSAVEHALVPAFVALVANRYRPSRVHSASDPTAFLNGQLILVRASTLREAGGFAAVSDTVLEDVALARRLKASGAKLRLADARALAATRMYASYTELREGFGKNALALHGGALHVVMLALLGVAIAWGPLWSLAATALSGTQAALGAAAALWVFVVVTQGQLRAQMGGARWPALLSPLVYLVVARVLLGAALSKETRWRGRVYAAR